VTQQLLFIADTPFSGFWKTCPAIELRPGHTLSRPSLADSSLCICESECYELTCNGSLDFMLRRNSSRAFMRTTEEDHSLRSVSTIPKEASHMAYGILVSMRCIVQQVFYRSVHGSTEIKIVQIQCNLAMLTSMMDAEDEGTVCVCNML